MLRSGRSANMRRRWHFRHLGGGRARACDACRPRRWDRHHARRLD